MEDYLPGVKYVVYLMLENRSLDSVLGWLYDDKNQPHNFIPKASASKPYDGLKPNTYWNRDKQGKVVYASQIAASEGQGIPDVDPNECYVKVQMQIADDQGNKMGGFLKDFQTTTTTNPNSIMQAYTPESLPVINALAQQFAVSDAYFSSVPSNTDANRAFALSGNSIGTGGTYGTQPDTAMVDTHVHYTRGIPPYAFTRRCLWDVLWEAGLRHTTDWSVFYHQTWPGPNAPPIVGSGSQCFTQLMIDSLQKYDKMFFRQIDQFYRILNGAPNTQMPTFSYLEPCWNLDYNGKTYQNGNDYHPPGHLTCGEFFLETLFNKLQASKYWNETLLIINFDEHGGTYDHVEPPENVMAPWTNQRDGTAPPANYAVPFDFTRLGVRVPLLLISPLIEEKTVIRSDTSVPFDHTSIIATILNFFKIDASKWQLGSRTASAPTFESVITRQTPRPPVTLPQAKPGCKPAFAAMAEAAQALPDGEVQSLPASIMARAIAKIARDNNVPDSELRELFKQHFADIRTTSQLHEKAGAIISSMCPAPVG